jgi:hypothetical protein
MEGHVLLLLLDPSEVLLEQGMHVMTGHPSESVDVS